MEAPVEGASPMDGLCEPIRAAAIKLGDRCLRSRPLVAVMRGQRSRDLNLPGGPVPVLHKSYAINRADGVVPDGGASVGASAGYVDQNGAPAARGDGGPRDTPARPLPTLC